MCKMIHSTRLSNVSFKMDLLLDHTHINMFTAFPHKFSMKKKSQQKDNLRKLRKVIRKDGKTARVEMTPSGV